MTSFKLILFIKIYLFLNVSFRVYREFVYTLERITWSKSTTWSYSSDSITFLVVLLPGVSAKGSTTISFRSNRFMKISPFSGSVMGWKCIKNNINQYNWMWLGKQFFYKNINFNINVTINKFWYSSDPNILRKIHFFY